MNEYIKELLRKEYVGVRDSPYYNKETNTCAIPAPYNEVTKLIVLPKVCNDSKLEIINFKDDHGRPDKKP